MLEIQEKIYLGGQISQKYKIFQAIARMTPQYAKPYFIIKNMDRWENMSEDEVILEIIEFLGEVEFVNQCTELSKLSMVMGDTRKRINITEGVNALRHSKPDSST